jgi:tight adherence protein B
VTALLVAAGLAGWSTWVATSAGPAELRIRGLHRSPWSAPARRIPPTALVTGLLVLGVALTLWLRSVVPVLAVPAVAYGLRRWRAAAAERAAATRNRAAVTELCAAFCAELRAGRHPGAALVRAAGDGLAGSAIPQTSIAARSVAAAGVGGDVAAALAADAEQPGAEALRRLAACWRVAHTRGAGLAAAVERLVGSLRSEQQHRQEVAAELAGARATARILAALPAVGLLMGTGLGAQPLEVLLRTSYGSACLIAGVGLVGAGLLWTERIARAAERAA